jgi:hydrogenase-4 membrane subunit HyfE
MTRQLRNTIEYVVERSLFLAAAGSILITLGIISVLVFETVEFLLEVPIT